MPSKPDEKSSTVDQGSQAFRQGLVRRVFIPVALLAVILVPSFNVLKSASLPDLNYLLCQMSIVKSDEPPSDMVFFGSSRTGAAIDAEAVAGAFDGTLETAEKVVLTLGSEFDRDLAYRTYAKYRGVPRVLAIELSFERRPDRIEEQGSVLGATGRTSTLFETDVYQQMAASMRAGGEITLADTYVRSVFPSTPSFFFDRLGVGVDQALRSPSNALSPTDECTWSFKRRKGRWVVGNTKPFVEAKAKLPSQKDQEKWIKRLSDSRTFDFDDSWTEQELAYLEDLVSTAYGDGVETVILYYLPSFSEDADVIDLEGLQLRLPEAVIFDGRTVLDEDTRPSLRYQYHDRNHVNKFAAYEISVAVAEMAEETTP